MDSDCISSACLGFMICLVVQNDETEKYPHISPNLADVVIQSCRETMV